MLFLKELMNLGYGTFLSLLGRNLIDYGASWITCSVADTLASFFMLSLAEKRYYASLTLLLSLSLLSSATLKLDLWVGKEQRPEYLPLLPGFLPTILAAYFLGDTISLFVIEKRCLQLGRLFKVWLPHDVYLQFWDGSESHSSMFLILMILRLISYLSIFRLIFLPCLKGNVLESSKSCCI